MMILNAFRDKKRGFNLIEVNLAIFLVAGGLLVLFSLFPLGLHQSQAAVEDSQEAMFADFVLSKIESTAMALTNADDWVTDSSDANHSRFISFPDDPLIKAQEGDNPTPLTWPAGGDAQLKYSLVIKDISTDHMLKTVQLTVKSGMYGRLNAASRTYVTDLVYSGM